VILARHGDRSAIHQLPRTKKVEWDCGASDDVQELWKRFSVFQVVNVRTERSVPVMYYQPAGLGSEHRNCEPGKLTKEGFLQHLRLGKHLRKSYSSALKLTDRNFSDWFYARSTNYPRTIQSAIGLLMGLLAPNTPSQSHKHPRVRIMVNDQDEDEIMHGVGLVASSKHSELYPGQPEKEHLGNCPRAIHTLKKQMSEFTLKDTIREELVELFSPSVAGRSITDVSDQVHARICHSLSLPCNDQGQCMSSALALSVSAEANRLYCEKYHGPHGGKTAALLSMYPFLSEILQVLQDNANGGSNVRLAVFVGHDTVIAPILSSLGVSECGWPPYASRIAFELWEKRPGVPSHIRILFNGNPITQSVPGCSEELCKLDTLLAHVGRSLDPSGSFEETCQD
jgi:hypothetical protein